MCRAETVDKAGVGPCTAVEGVVGVGFCTKVEDVAVRAGGGPCAGTGEWTGPDISRGKWSSL